MKTLPTSAGLKGLLPSPPKVIFAIAIETKHPITIIKIGIFDGRLNARSNPVTTADPSVIDTGFLKINLCMRYSNERQEIIDTEETMIAPIPK